MDISWIRLSHFVRSKTRRIIGILIQELKSYLSCKIYVSGNGGYFHGSLDLRSAKEYFLSPLGNKRSKMLLLVSSHAE